MVSAVRAVAIKPYPDLLPPCGLPPAGRTHTVTAACIFGDLIKQIRCYPHLALLGWRYLLKQPLCRGVPDQKCGQLGTLIRAHRKMGILLWCLYCQTQRVRPGRCDYPDKAGTYGLRLDKWLWCAHWCPSRVFLS